jgi:hypothetical protein
MLGHSSEATVLEDAHVPWALPDDGSNFVHVEPAENAEQDHLSLIWRQARTNQGDGCVGCEHIDGGHRIVIGEILAQGVRPHRNAPAARFVPLPVDQAVPRDGEHPRAELLVVAPKGGEASSGREPSVGLNVFCCQRIEPAQEPQQPRMVFLPQDRDRPLSTPLGSPEHVAELGRRHG